MEIKNILLTGDDGYNSLGTRVLIDCLKDNYQLMIAGTKKQQSGVGGKATLEQDIKWGKENVDGIDAFWIEGTPVDAMLFAKNYLKEKFDLVISGINLGPNLGGSACTSSGTYAAGFMAMNLQMARKGLVMSWDCPARYWLVKNSQSQELKKAFYSIGETVKKVLDIVFKSDFWGCELLNINFPEEISKEIVFTKPISDMASFYTCDPRIDEKNHLYNYKPDTIEQPGDHQYDGPAVKKGYISITPCRIDVLQADIYSKLKDKIIRI